MSKHATDPLFDNHNFGKKVLNIDFKNDYVEKRA